MVAYNPDNHRLYSLASAVRKKSTVQTEITRSGTQLRIKTSEVDFKLSPRPYHQVSLNVRMAPATAFTSLEVLNSLLLETLLQLARKAGIQTEDPRAQFKVKSK